VAPSRRISRLQHLNNRCKPNPLLAFVLAALAKVRAGSGEQSALSRADRRARPSSHGTTSEVPEVGRPAFTLTMPARCICMVQVGSRL
jgi:hypothetical protein